MTTRPRGLALLILGVAISLGCSGGASFHLGQTNQRRCRDAEVDSAFRYATDGLPDVSRSLDSSNDGRSLDNHPGEVFDASFERDGEADSGEAPDACDDVSNLDGGRACGQSPWILVGEVPNVRQLGGIPLVGGGSVACDLIYRGSYLTALTSNGCEQFVATGIQTVIDLRSESEQSSSPAACVAENVRVVSAPMATPYNLSPADYLADLYTTPSMRAVFAILANRAAYPVYYHCLYGRDRTGVVTAVILSALGASRQTIQAEYALSGEAGVSYYPESLNAVLDELERLGGVDGYFRAIGVPPEQVQAMRAILGAQ
jgi:hypothetical protein